MKRLSTILFFLLFIAKGTYAKGTYYLYNTNHDFNKFVANLIQTNYQSVENLVTFCPSLTGIKETKSAKRKTFRTVEPNKFASLDQYARTTPMQYERDIKTLAQYLIRPATSDIEKVRVIYTWVATHVRYDDYAYNSGKYPDYSPKTVLANKRAVCAGYANLMVALCEAAGLDAEKIIGYSKGYGYRIGDKFTKTDHAWNAVKVDNEWHLFDVTWGSGFGTNINGRLVSTSEFDPFWFNVNPKAFIFTHLPLDPKWQLTGEYLSLDKYEALPYLPGSFFTLGFDPDKIYSEAVSGNVNDFVETFSIDYPIKAVQLPYTRTLNRGDKIRFEIQSDYAQEIALIEDGTWHFFKKYNNSFILSHKPVGNQLKISVKSNWSGDTYSTIAEYSITGNGNNDFQLQYNESANNNTPEKAIKIRHPKLITIKIGGSTNYLTDDFNNLNYPIRNQISYQVNTLLGFNLGRAKRNTTMGLFGNYGKYNPNNSTFLNNNLFSTSNNFLEIEGGFLIKEFFRISGGLGYKLSNSTELTSNNYITSSAGFSFGPKWLKFDISNTLIIPKHDKKLICRPSIGLSFALRILNKKL